MSVRQDVADLIAHEWAGWSGLQDVRVVATERDLDDIQVPTLQIRFRSVERGTAQGIRDYTFLAVLMSGYEDFDAAADELDGVIPNFRDWLDTTGIRAGATTIVVAGNRLAAETPITVYTSQGQE